MNIEDTGDDAYDPRAVPPDQREVVADSFSPLAMRDITAAFVESNGWEPIVTTVPGTAQVKMLYKSPITGHFHSLSFALGMVLENHGIPAV